jgi:hypothetical protein
VDSIATPAPSTLTQLPQSRLSRGQNVNAPDSYIQEHTPQRAGPARAKRQNLDKCVYFI